MEPPPENGLEDGQEEEPPRVSYYSYLIGTIGGVFCVGKEASSSILRSNYSKSCRRCCTNYFLAGGGNGDGVQGNKYSPALCTLCIIHGQIKCGW